MRLSPGIKGKFQESGRLPIVVKILNSNDKRKIKNLYDVFEKYGLRFQDYI